MKSRHIDLIVRNVVQTSEIHVAFPRKFLRYFRMHAVMHRGNQEFFFHTIIRLWLVNKKTSSNQRRANGATAASWHNENRLRILGASNAGFFNIIWGLALRVLDGVEAEITTLKRRMDNKDQRLKTHPMRTPNVIKWWNYEKWCTSHPFLFLPFFMFLFSGEKSSDNFNMP